MVNVFCEKPHLANGVIPCLLFKLLGFEVEDKHCKDCPDRFICFAAVFSEYKRDLEEAYADLALSRGAYGEKQCVPLPDRNYGNRR